MVPMVIYIFEIIATYQNIFLKTTKIKFLTQFLLQKLCLCPAILWSNADFVPQNHGAMQTLPAKSQSLCSLPRKMPETLFFAPKNYGAMQTLPRKIMET